MAVLPTPGSPTRTGLFFVLRERMRVTARISASRPITGSSLPAFARATRSVPYFLSASYFSSGVSLVTCWLPRTDLSAARTALSVTPARRSASATPDVFASATIARRTCSTLTYSSPMRRAVSSAAARTRESSCET